MIKTTLYEGSGRRGFICLTLPILGAAHASLCQRAFCCYIKTNSYSIIGSCIYLNNSKKDHIYEVSFNFF